MRALVVPLLFAAALPGSAHDHGYWRHDRGFHRHGRVVVVERPYCEEDRGVYVAPRPRIWRESAPVWMHRHHDCDWEEGPVLRFQINLR